MLEKGVLPEDRASYLIDETYPDIAQDTYNAIAERVMLGVTLDVITPEEAETHLADIRQRLLPSPETP